MSVVMFCNGVEMGFVSRDNFGTIQAASWGTLEEPECTLEASAEDVSAYAGKSALSVADRVLIALLKRVPN